MAGGGAKIAGALLFTLGAVLIIIGAGTIGLAVNDQADNEQSGPLGTGEDQDRTQRNMAGVQGAIVAMIVGAVLAIGGIVAIAIGIGQRTSELRDGVRQAQQQSVVVTDGVADGEAVVAQQQATQGMSRPAIVGLALVGVLLLSGVVVTAFGVGPVAETLGLDDTEPALIATRADDRTVPASATILGSSQAMENTEHALDAPAGTVRIEALVNWTPADQGLQEIQFTIEYLDGETWRQLATATGPSGLRLTATDAEVPGGALLDHELRYTAYPGEDGVTNGQDYSVTFAFYRS